MRIFCPAISVLTSRRTCACRPWMSPTPALGRVAPPKRTPVADVMGCRGAGGRQVPDLRDLAVRCATRCFMGSATPAAPPEQPQYLVRPPDPDQIAGSRPGAPSDALSPGGRPVAIGGPEPGEFGRLSTLASSPGQTLPKVRTVPYLAKPAKWVCTYQEGI